MSNEVEVLYEDYSIPRSKKIIHLTIPNSAVHFNFDKGAYFLDLRSLGRHPNLETIRITTNIAPILPDFGDNCYLRAFTLSAKFIRYSKVEDISKTFDLSPFSRCKQLMSLTLKEIGLKSLNLTPLSQLKNFSGLNVFKNKIENIDLEPLGECNNLRLLNVAANYLREIDLTPLKRCQQLTILNLSHNQLREIDLSLLQHCDNIRLLNVAANYLKKIDLTPLKRCKQLGTLNLSHNQLQEVDLSLIKHCIYLQNLILNDNDLQEIDILPLQNCPNLKKLFLESNEIKELNFGTYGFLKLEHLKVDSYLSSLKLVTLPQLRKLEVGLSATVIECLSLLKESRHLKELVLLFDEGVQTVDLSFLESCAELEELSIFGPSLHSLNLTPLENCPELRRLHISGYFGGGLVHLSSLDLQPLHNCKKLKDIKILTDAEVDVMPLVKTMKLHDDLYTCQIGSDDDLTRTTMICDERVLLDVPYNMAYSFENIKLIRDDESWNLIEGKPLPLELIECRVELRLYSLQEEFSKKIWKDFGTYRSIQGLWQDVDGPALPCSCGTRNDARCRSYRIFLEGVEKSFEYIEEAYLAIRGTVEHVSDLLDIIIDVYVY